MLDGDEPAEHGVPGRALRVAVALGPDFRQVPGAVGRGVVGRDRAVRIDADDRAGMVLHVLRAVSLAAVAGGDEKRAIRREHQPRAEMARDVGLLRHREDDLDIVQTRRASVAHQLRARDSRAGAALAGLGEAEEDEVGAGEIGRGDDVEQAALAARRDLWHARDGSDSSPPERSRMRPGRSVTIASPLGRKSRPQGFCSPSATTSASIGTASVWNAADCARAELHASEAAASREASSVDLVHGTGCRLVHASAATHSAAGSVHMPSQIG